MFPARTQRSEAFEQSDHELPDPLGQLICCRARLPGCLMQRLKCSVGRCIQFQCPNQTVSLSALSHQVIRTHLEQEPLWEAVQAGALWRHRGVVGFSLPRVGQQGPPLEQGNAVLQGWVLEGAQHHLQAAPLLTDAISLGRRSGIWGQSWWHALLQVPA